MAEMSSGLLPAGTCRRLLRRRLRQTPRNSDEEQKGEVDAGGHHLLKPNAQGSSLTTRTSVADRGRLARKGRR
jgi:hypothetical protein